MKAEFEIFAEHDDPSTSTFACTKHVGELLSSAEGKPESKRWAVVVVDDGAPSQDCCFPECG